MGGDGWAPFGDHQTGAELWLLVGIKAYPIGPGAGAVTAHGSAPQHVELPAIKSRDHYASAFGSGSYQLPIGFDTRIGIAGPNLISLGARDFCHSSGKVPAAVENDPETVGRSQG